MHLINWKSPPKFPGFYEPGQSTYTEEEVLKLTGIAPDSLQGLIDRGVVRPQVTAADDIAARRYAIWDLIALIVTCKLIRIGLEAHQAGCIAFHAEQLAYDAVPGEGGDFVVFGNWDPPLQMLDRDALTKLNPIEPMIVFNLSELTKEICEALPLRRKD